MNIISENYLKDIQIVTEMNLIHEGFGDFVKRFKTNKLEKLKTDIKKVKDVEGLKKVTAFIPKMHIDKIDNIAKKQISGFKVKKEKAAKKLNKNTPEKYIGSLTTIAALASTDDKSMNDVTKKINRVNWEKANHALVVNIMLSFIIAGLLSIPTFGVMFFPLLGMFLLIDAIIYLVMIAFED